MTTLVLGVDAACARCRAVGAVVARTCPELEVLPLGDYRVAAWRAEALGTDAPWAPTLLAVRPGPDADVVRAWHGPRLVPGLLATLGPRRAWALARALQVEGLAPEMLRGLVRRPSPGRAA